MRELDRHFLMMMLDKPVDMMDKSSAAGYIASLTSAIIGAVTMENLYWLGSLLIGAFIALTNFYFKVKEDKRREERHTMAMSIKDE
jgi:hypothetical protein